MKGSEHEIDKTNSINFVPFCASAAVTRENSKKERLNSVMEDFAEQNIKKKDF